MTQRGTFLILVVAASLTLAAAALSPTTTPPAVTPTPTPWPRPPRVASPGYGVNVSLWWDPWAAVRRDWPLVEQAGFTWAKQRLAWIDVEGAAPGHYEWAASDRLVEATAQAHINLVFRVDSPPAWALLPTPTTPVSPTVFGQFCHTLAARYAGRVRGYQVWNEPNLAREWHDALPDPAGYVALLRACYVGIKEADPQALVISAGLAPTGSGPPEALPDTEFLRAMYEAGASPYFDMLGLNAPGYKAPPEISPDEAADPNRDYGGQRFFCFRHVEEMRAIMEHYGDANKQVAILEFGWTTDTNPAHQAYTWFAVSPEQQADYLVRAFYFARDHWSPWIGPMFVWNFPDPRWTPDNEEFWWSVVDPFWWGFNGNYETWKGGAVRPAYISLAEMAK